MNTSSSGGPPTEIRGQGYVPIFAYPQSMVEVRSYGVAPSAAKMLRECVASKHFLYNFANFLKHPIYGSRRELTP